MKTFKKDILSRDNFKIKKINETEVMKDVTEALEKVRLKIYKKN